MDQGPRDAGGQSQIQLITWFLFVVAVLGVCARLGTKYAMTSKLSRDDGLILGAFVGEMALITTHDSIDHSRKATYLPQCISITVSATSGLGQASVSLTSESIDNVIKV